MNDDDAAPDLETLKAEHRRLDQEIERMRGDGSDHQLDLARLKKRKLVLKDQIERMKDRAIPDIIA